MTEVDPKTGALLARNAYNTEFADRVVFLDASESKRTVTGDRSEFLGRNGTPRDPACLARVRLSGRVGAGLDPCAAMQVAVDLADGQEREIVFTFGSGRDLADTRNLVHRFRGIGPARAALEGVWKYWNRTLGAVYVETPDPAVNFLANGWLLYQMLACRMWGRSGFYQSGGAFGFRDQLQDVMALVHAEPALLREHLLRCAGRQFREGDVQHWWHPPRAAACARTSPTISSGCPTRRAAMSTRSATPACSTKRSRFWRGDRSSRRRRATTICPPGPKNRPRSTNIACARSSTACASASTACR